MLADVFNCQKQQIWPFRKCKGLWFPHSANLLGHVSPTKIRVHSFIDAENLRRTTLHRTDIYRNLSLGAPGLATLLDDVWTPSNIRSNNFKHFFCSHVCLVMFHCLVRLASYNKLETCVIPFACMHRYRTLSCICAYKRMKLSFSWLESFN